MPHRLERSKNDRKWLYDDNRCILYDSIVSKKAVVVFSIMCYLTPELNVLCLVDDS